MAHAAWALLAVLALASAQLAAGNILLVRLGPTAATVSYKSSTSSTVFPACIAGKTTTQTGTVANALTGTVNTCVAFFLACRARAHVVLPEQPEEWFFLENACLTLEPNSPPPPPVQNSITYSNPEYDCVFTCSALLDFQSINQDSATSGIKQYISGTSSGFSAYSKYGLFQSKVVARGKCNCGEETFGTDSAAKSNPYYYVNITTASVSPWGKSSPLLRFASLDDLSWLLLDSRAECDCSNAFCSPPPPLFFLVTQSPQVLGTSNPLSTSGVQFTTLSSSYPKYTVLATTTSATAYSSTDSAQVWGYPATGQTFTFVFMYPTSGSQVNPAALANGVQTGFLGTGYYCASDYLVKDGSGVFLGISAAPRAAAGALAALAVSAGVALLATFF